MPITGKYYDLGESVLVHQAVIREGGDEIAFDMKHSDGHLYSVLLKRNNGHIFTGRAFSDPARDVADVTCRVYVDRDEGITLISGSKWVQKGETHNYQWMVELQEYRE